jgi:hypothetical protein
MSEEKELLTILSREEHEDVLIRLKKEFGEPKTQKRLSLQSDDYDQEDIDTRIKITNGEVELVQKVGDWKNITKGKSRTENSISLKKDAKFILVLNKILRNLVKGTNTQNIIMQYENLIWKKADFEIKLTHQFGNGNAYNCEVEVFNNSVKPKDLMKKLDIPIHLPAMSQDFWREWNKKVNLSADGLSNKELLEVIKKYLD